MNKEKAIEKRQIIKHINARLDRGEPKQQILEELSQLYKDKVTIMKRLESTPSKIMKYKYRTYNYLLAALLLAALVFDVVLLSQIEWEFGKWTIKWIIDFNAALSVVLDSVFLVGVLLYRIETYSWIASRALVSLITIMVSFYHFGVQSVDPLFYASLTLIVFTFIFGLLLSVKLCPSRVPKVIEVDIDGIEKINKTIYVFPD